MYRKPGEGMSASERARHSMILSKAKPCRTFGTQGVDVGMVQVGNEINNGMAGEEDVDTVMDLIIRKPCGAWIARITEKISCCRSLYQY